MKPSYLAAGAALLASPLLVKALNGLPISTLVVLFGLLFLAPQVYGLAQPAGFGAAARKFPRSESWGYALMGLGTIWFLLNVQSETISDFAAYKKLMLFGFGAIGVLTCLYVKDYLAVRGLAVVLLLLAKLFLDKARWHDSSWRVAVSVLCYVWIVAGIWLTVSPWRLRDFIAWATANEFRIRIGSAVRLAIALFFIFLGVFPLR